MALASLLLLTACASAPPVTHTAQTGSASQGYYKVGKPYYINGTLYTPAFDPNYDETGIASWYAGEFTGQPTGNGELYDPNQLTAAHRTLPMPSLVRVTNLDNGRALIVRINDRGPYAQNRIIDMSRRAAQLLGFERQGTAKVRVQILAKDSEALADAAKRGELATTVASAIETNPAATPEQVASAEAQPEPAAASQPPSQSVEATPLADQAGGIAVVDEKAIIKQDTGTAAPPGKDVGGRFMPAPVVQSQPVSTTRIFIQAGAFASTENANKLRDRLASFGAQIEPVAANGQQLYRVRVGPVADVAGADQKLAQIIQAGVPEAKIIVE